jgi:molybdenum cofactor cytidylyltransferase
MVDCAAIVLAAGDSTRLGRPKQLIQIEGESLLRRTVRLAVDAGCSPVLAILGRDTERLSTELHGLDATVIHNEEWRSGMASSLKRGLRAALGIRPHLGNAMILVCDQPGLDSFTLQNLLATHQLRQPAVTASRYRDTLGVPAVFSKNLFPELLDLTGDQGARRILQQHRNQTASIEFPAGEFDLDTPEDLARLGLKRLHQ